MTRFRTGLVAIAAVSVMLTGTAGATGGGTTTAANSTLVGSGSATTYNMMQAMDTLYNDSPGCNLIDIGSVTQQLDFGCPAAANTTPPPNVSSSNTPYPDFATSPGYTENPANDASMQEPPYGSGNGIKQLETASPGSSTCASTTATAPLDYARSSRAAGSTDCKGLNFVAYAVDGVSWFHYVKVNGVATPSAAVLNMSQALLTDAYTGSLQCWNDPVVAAGSGTPTFTYATSGCQPIILYTAQAGSGTTNTWQTFVGVNPATYLQTQNGATFTIQKPDGTTGTETYNANDHVILENEDRQIIANGDEANALFFFSYGKYNVTCKKGLCGKITPKLGTTSEQFGKINKIAASTATILCGAGLSSKTCTIHNSFSPTRFVYNVYSNGSNANIPQASFSTLNYVSELGFICKPNTSDGTSTGTPIVDPNTGATYRTEISAVITAQGFLTIPFRTNEGAVPHSAYSILHPHTGDGGLNGEISSVDTLAQSSSSPAGYCLDFTTDNNTAS